jgi:hypothetical protein
MTIYGYDVTLSDATVLLALFTAISAIFTALAAVHTRRLAQYNKEIITQSEIQHRERFRPLCFPMTNKREVIADFNEVLIPSKTTMSPDGIYNTFPDPRMQLIFLNKGLGPAINLRFHINDIRNQRITKDFLVSHVLPPDEIFEFTSKIPLLSADHGDGKTFTMSPHDIISNAYFFVCEYESMFSGDVFHSIVAKGYQDPALADDGMNQWRLNRPITPPVEFEPGLDPAKPIWPVPPEGANYPAAFLNFPSQPENGQPK